MHIIVMVVTVFFFDGSKPPRTVLLPAPSMAACRAAGPKLKAEGLADEALGIRDVAWTCVDQHRGDNA